MLVCKCGADVTYLDTGCLEVSRELCSAPTTYRAWCAACGECGSRAWLTREAAISDWYDVNARIVDSQP